MTNNSELVKARNAMTTILAAMKIEVVLSIDDEYGAVGFSKIIKIVEDELLSRRDWIKDLFPQVNFESPAEVYTQDLQMEWDSLSQDKRRALYDLLAPNAPVGGPSSVLSQICPLNVREYTPSQWDASYDQVLQEITPGHFGLVLFDQNLEDDTNYTATGSNSGLGLAQRLLASSYSNKVICGVLSHMFDMQSEMIRWREWVSGHQLKPAAILPISKARLNINKPLQFVDAIKATVLNSHYEVLKTFMRSVLGTANGQALNYIDELNPYAFNHIVISSSRADGIWEFDTLLRLFRIYQKDEIRDTPHG